MVTTARRIASECLGTALLLATVVGSGIMAEALAGGNVAVALLGNTLATGAILVVLITMFGPVSGAHFNPAVTLVMLASAEISRKEAASYVMAQVAGALAGVWLAHLMFDLTVLQMSVKARTGSGQWIAEGVATFGLLLTILLTRRHRPESIPLSVGLYITAAYWFTASTSFANPAVTLARAFSDSFAGIRLADVPAFVVAQLVGASLALVLSRWLLADGSKAPD
ncbi:aquaporin family protein [Rhizobium sp. KAs_5_22]|uniref:aquaporin n=1 Tax=Ciceribacter selenitireducens TaxID=448181 RepID=UPI00048F3488|nr:MIP/aquaporin family protein [Ciceribacter selenitireducens]PPJ46287.1 aquaporin family protein [Rhizobium sp. KAs_5_22]